MEIQKAVRSFPSGSNGNTIKIDEALKDGFKIKYITPFPQENYIEYIVEKDETPICNYIKLHEATKEQLLNELSKRIKED